MTSRAMYREMTLGQLRQEKKLLERELRDSLRDHQSVLKDIEKDLEGVQKEMNRRSEAQHHM